MGPLTPIEIAALKFVAERRVDRATGRVQSVDLREVGEAMRQQLISLAMKTRPLVDVDGPRVFITMSGEERLRELAEASTDVEQPPAKP